jgi:choline dehydrogenase-like flavoprotein
MTDRLALLVALADTLVPAVAAEGDDEVAAFRRRAAGDLGVAEILAPGLATAQDEFLEELGALGFADMDLPARTAFLHGLAEDPARRQALRELKLAVMGVFYALPDEDGRNPSWPALGFPGPASAPPSPAQAPKTIAIEELDGPTTIRADVCIVGSGAGGSVIAAELQAAGHEVVILERASYRNEADFRQLEAVGAGELYLHGGLFWSEGGSIGLLAGSTLGGGTVINSMVCLRPPADIRAEWAALGLGGLDGPGFDEHLDAVSQRLNVNAEATQPNRTNRMMAEALEARGLSWEVLPRNASPDDDPAFCGYCNAGCQQGCKQSALKTYLQDASDAGARVVVDCVVDHVLSEGGRAKGVVARARGTSGELVELTVAAPVVVIAAGGIESPAVLLRSGIGGPATGSFLRLHPTYFVGGVYDEVVNPWDGQFQALASFDFTHAVDGTGFLVESVNVSLPFWAGALPFSDGAAHKERMLTLRNVASWHCVTHDHGAGRVVLGHDGEAVVRWQLDDPVDRRLAARLHVELARLHEARGANEILTFHWDDHTWRRGEDFEAYVARLETTSYERTAYSAHQMGSCRMGADPACAVADGHGELHDTRGVWIGDASALPTAPGVNPMLTVMALARRTAHAILERAPAGARS